MTYWKNFIIWKKKSKILITNKLYIKQCYGIVWSVEKNTSSKNPEVLRTKNETIMLLSKCKVCDSKRSKFIKEQGTSGLLSSLGIKTPLNKISLFGPLLF